MKALQALSERPFGLSEIALSRLANLEKSRYGIIRFPLVFQKLCTSFQIPKDQAWRLLFSLRDKGYIDIVPYQGIKLGGCKHE